MNSSVNPAFEILTYCKDLTFSFLSPGSNSCTSKLAYAIAYEWTDAELSTYWRFQEQDQQLNEWDLHAQVWDTYANIQRNWACTYVVKHETITVAANKTMNINHFNWYGDTKWLTN